MPTSSIYTRGVNVNALMYAINQKNVCIHFYLMQINHIIRFDPNFLPSL